MSELRARRETPVSWLQQKTANALLGLGFPNYSAQKVGHKISNALAMLTPLGVAEDVTLQSRANVEAARRGERPSMTGNALAALGAAAGAVPGVRAAGKAASEGVERAGKGIIAYHGSPHKFDRFDMSKIGTGEGAQAYGHGLYFAENEGVARSYRDTLTSTRLPKDGQEFVAQNPADALWLGEQISDAAALAGQAVDRPEAMYQVINRLAGLDVASSHPAHDRAKAALDLIDAQIPAEVREFVKSRFSPNPGHLYQVRIDADPADFLDWDAPLSGQSERVREAYIRTAEKLNPRTAKMLVDADITGPSLARTLDGFPVPKDSQFAGLGPMRTPAMLNEQGIPGIKYLDAGSRGAGDGSRNYVVFDDKLVTILKRYGWVPGTAIPAAAAADYERETGQPVQTRPVA